ncbi:hypothetical protein CYJ73_18335 [Gordonia terrae]|uniref:Toxin n=1 Tax=Gordonia terrae TaxID=2055 RepID=A0A2I1R4N7_9ACTN|nr:hypothetical protein [Gordonia terrae]PKZ64096.1 hypothetical protein CYJ73_18335 [Gordonia terrae]
MAIEFTESAARHGFTLADAVHAMSNPRYHEAQFDDPRLGGIKPDLWIGPSLQPAVPLIEVMAEVIPPATVRIFHVMHARPKFLDRLDQEDNR